MKLGERRRCVVRTERLVNLAEDLVKRFVEPFDGECPVACVELSSCPHADVRTGLRAIPERRRNTPRAKLSVYLARAEAVALDDFELLCAGTAEHERRSQLGVSAAGEEGVERLRTLHQGREYRLGRGVRWGAWSFHGGPSVVSSRFCVRMPTLRRLGEEGEVTMPSSCAVRLGCHCSSVSDEAAVEQGAAGRHEMLPSQFRCGARTRARRHLTHQESLVEFAMHAAMSSLAVLLLTGLIGRPLGEVSVPAERAVEAGHRNRR
ncbi:MAG TPA: hypothetical protein VFX59_06225 [Polyangiales bacterium]|nr:hypothetical protein [Polyangiales bacterium]